MAMMADSTDRRALTYRRLNQRNRFVGLLRWAVPALGVLVTGGLIFEIIIANLATDYDMAGLTIVDGKVVIDEPRYGGSALDGSHYEVVADTALVPLTDSEQVDLQQAKINIVDDRDFEIEARAGLAHLDLSRERVTIDGLLETTDSDGVEGQLYQTNINWRGQQMRSHGPVRFDFPDGSAIAADALTYNADDKIWRFGATVYTNPGDEEQAATTITSDQMEYDTEAPTANFMGNAVVEQQDTTVRSESLLVHFGEGGTSNLRTVEALGGVTIVDAKQTATGDRGTYDPNSRVMDLIGSVKVVSETGTITATQLSIDLSSNATEFSTNGQGRVHGDFSPPGADRAQIVADRLIDLPEENRTEFSGSTEVDMGNQTIWSNRFFVHYEPNNPDAIANYEMLGAVRIRNPEQTATGDRGVYDPDTRILRLTGNVQVTNASGTVNAPELRVNLATNVSEFSGESSGNRVSGVFSPDNPPQTQ